MGAGNDVYGFHFAKSCSLTEFVGTAIGDTLGLVIANVDAALLEAMKLEKRYRSIGILGARTGAGPHIMAADEAVKATNTEVVSIELPRDTKGGAGHGSLIVLGGNDVSDVKRNMTRFVAVDIAEGTVQLFQRDLNPAFDVGNIIPAQHNQRAMAGAAFGVARKLNAH